MIYFMLAILAILVAVSLARGYRLGQIAKMAMPGVKDALIVVEVLILIGSLTGLWRSSGTIAYFITVGVRVLPPMFFVLSAFLLTAVMSLAIGTSFGVVATAGVILMSIARAGDVPLIPVAGAIMSGIYVGDRNSPAASSATLVATVTGTDLNRNIKIMLSTSVVPLLVCTGAYTGLSLLCPMKSFDPQAVALLEENFRLSWICIVPAIMMIVLPMCKVKVKLAMAADIVVSFLIAVLLQGQGVLTALKTMLLGYASDAEPLAALLDGGGISSMFSVCIILLISGTFGQIMQGTGLLDKVYDWVSRMRDKIGRFASTLVLSVLSCMLFCNQTIGVMMVNQLGAKLYDPETEKYAKMIDMEDSVILIAGLVPWCIASSVPLATMGVGAAALPLSFFLWLVPLWRLIRRRPVAGTVPAAVK